MARNSRIAGFYKQTISDRLGELRDRGFLAESDYLALLEGRQTLSPGQANKLVENVVGVFGLPMGLGLNFLVNGKDYIVPMVVEEPSIIAAVSYSAKLFRAGGGFEVTSDRPLIVGQIQVVEVPDIAAARRAITDEEQELLNLANSLHPRMVARGGGARRLQLRTVPYPGGEMLVVHLVVDSCDAMGANLVNSMCESLAPTIEKLSGGKVFLRILSNLTDLAMVKATARVSVDLLKTKAYSGEQVRDGVVLAGHFAEVDPYRATTHNKGVMNGIDAAVIATGNDWRAVEAAAHAYVGLGESYGSMTRWTKDGNGDLVGRIELPIKVGTVGGPVQSNPAVRVCHAILGNPSAQELAEVLACVGLAQNFAALRALATEGIQKGHMALHARNCAAAGGATGDILDSVVEALIDSGEIKVWKARELVDQLRQRTPRPKRETRVPSQALGGAGAFTVLGGPLLTAGQPAITARVPVKNRARVRRSEQPGIRTLIPAWGVDETLDGSGDGQLTSVGASIDLIARELGCRGDDLVIDVYAEIPRGAGLGSSEAMSRAVILGLADCVGRTLSPTEVDDLVVRCERIASGESLPRLGHIGEGALSLFDASGQWQELDAQRSPTFIVAVSNIEQLAVEADRTVRQAIESTPKLVETMQSALGDLAAQGVLAMKSGNLELFGKLMDASHGLLSAMGLTNATLDGMVHRARARGALGAKAVGAGGSIVALCSPDIDGAVETLLESFDASVQTFVVG